MADRLRPQREQRREQFLDLTADLLQREGVSAVTMERVSALAGVSKPVIYRHFRDRGDLLVALLERCWHDIDTAVQARLAEASTFDQRVEALVVGYFDATAQQGALVRLMIGNASQEPVVEHARQARQRAAEAEWSDFYQRRGGLAPEVADACAAILRAALQGAAEHWVEHPGTTSDRTIETCLSIMHAALSRLRREARQAAPPGAAARPRPRRSTG